jgi:hypothetical protein
VRTSSLATHFLRHAGNTLREFPDYDILRSSMLAGEPTRSASSLRHDTLQGCWGKGRNYFRLAGFIDEDGLRPRHLRRPSDITVRNGTVETGDAAGVDTPPSRAQPAGPRACTFAWLANSFCLAGFISEAGCRVQPGAWPPAKSGTFLGGPGAAPFRCPIPRRKTAKGVKSRIPERASTLAGRRENPIPSWRLAASR